jgi:RNA polymerase sigma factor (sigma-70 family)
VNPPPQDVAAFYDATCARLVRQLIAAGASRADAEEIAQDAFVRLLPRWASVSRYDEPFAWVRSVAMRLLISRARRARVAHLGLARLGAQTPTSSLDASGLAVEQALSQLPVPQRVVVVLHHLLDLSVEQVAAELRIPEGTVKSRLSRARAALKPLLSLDETNDEESSHA